ncbi:uncharacterized protein [Elaeis guineensis]|uniref:uncharacterized protein n=1 Tax=Elaeis guineensis var. tenera TaxID=51953 RepID=UPI003C6D892B
MMVRVATYFMMSFRAFLFWQSMEKFHVWITLHQDEKDPGIGFCIGEIINRDRLDSNLEVV